MELERCRSEDRERRMDRGCVGDGEGLYSLCILVKTTQVEWVPLGVDDLWPRKRMADEDGCGQWMHCGGTEDGWCH